MAELTNISNPRLKKKLEKNRTVFSFLQTQTTFYNDLEEFGSDTSAHGLKYVFESPRLLTKVIFAAIWMLAVCYALFAIGTNIIKFIEKPTGTKLEVKVSGEIGADSMKFPTITVCSQITEKKSYFEHSDNKQILDYIRTLESSDPTRHNLLLERLNDTDDEMYSIRDKTLFSIYRDGRSNADRLLSCKGRAATVCEKMEAFKNSEYYTMETSAKGKCWRINPHGTLHRKLGDYGSLKLMFWADIQDTSFEITQRERQGFIVSFHDNETYGGAMPFGHLMSPGSYYKVDLQRKEITRSEDARNSCNSSLTQTAYGAFSEGSCIAQCRIRFLQEQCGCVDVLPPIDTLLYRACSLEEWARCGHPKLMFWENEFTNTSQDICKCQTGCKQVEFDASISNSILSPQFAQTMYTQMGPLLQNFSNPKFNISYNSYEDVLQNLMIMEVLFSSMQKYHIQEIITYDTYNLLGDVGGVLGLFLGASLFTIIEFILFGVLSVAKYCCRATASGWLDVT